MPRGRPRSALSKKAPTPGKADSPPEVSKKSADQGNQTTSPEVTVRRGRPPKRGPQPRQLRTRKESNGEAPALLEAAGSDNKVGKTAPKHGSSEETAATAPKKSRATPDEKVLPKLQEHELQEENTRPKTRQSDEPLKKELSSEESSTTSGARSDGKGDQKAIHEIITTEATRKLDHVPRAARLVENPTELRRLLEDINLGHLPRNQTKFVAWYQIAVGGVFYREPVESVHQSLKSGYFRLKSGSVLKFNRTSSDRP